MARPTTKRASDFGARMTEARKAAGFTQMQLAERLGISQQMVDYYERRANNPTADFVRKAAEVLNVSVDELLGHKTKTIRKSGPPSQLEQRLVAIKQLPKDKQKMVLHFLDSFLRDVEQSKAS